jgi:uncharacterized membrane protein YgcG
MAPVMARIMVCALGFLMWVCVPGYAAVEAAEPIEQVSLFSALVMLGFLLIAALVVVSFVCKCVIAFGIVAKPRASRLGRVILFLANATGSVRVVTSERASSGGSHNSGGGGSAGGAGASGDF